MRKTITIGGKEVELECNLGTATFYQELTGKNLFEMIPEIGRKMSEAALALREAKEAHPEDDTDPEVVRLTGEIGKVAHQATAEAEALAFIMETQAKFGKSREDIAKIRALLTKDDLLAWKMDLGPTAITYSTYTELAKFWGAQTKSTTEPKNA